MTSLRLAAVTIFVVVVIELTSFVVFANVGPTTLASESTVKNTGHVITSEHDGGHDEMHQHGRYSVVSSQQMPKSTEAFASADDCIHHPNISSCWNYTLPNASADVALNCKRMPSMVGCSIEKICTNNAGSLGHDQYCQPFSVLKDLCTTPGMSRMSGCLNYTAMCAPDNSVVRECKTQIIPRPTDDRLKQLIKSICKNMYMSDCDKCQLNSNNMNCDLLVVYSDLCLSMSDMEQCDPWKNMCDYIPNWPICPSDNPNDQVPMMRMYFHTGLVDYVLFKQWVPRSWGEYVATFLAIVVLGIVHEVLRTLRLYLEDKWLKRTTVMLRQPSTTLSGESSMHVQLDDGKEEAAFHPSKSHHPTQQEDHHHHHHHASEEVERRWTWIPFRWSVDLPRALLAFIELGISLLLMLVAMTFNVGLFIAVCTGGAVGLLICSRFSSRPLPVGCH